MASLVVLVGAGGSKDCSTRPGWHRDELQPPVTSELFTRRFQVILENYPRLQSVAPDIRDATKDESVLLENYLRDELRDSALPEDQAAYREVPLYLQHVLYEVSEGYTSHADNYDRLIGRVLRLDETIFVTSNYDTLLERRLEARTGHRLYSIPSYLKGRNWALIKVHGSVDWGHRVLNDVSLPRAGDIFFTEMFAEFGADLKLDEEITLLRSMPADPNEPELFTRMEGGSHTPGVYDLREKKGPDSGLYYPALAVPLGSADMIVCPPSHESHLRARLKAQTPLNLLVIGYNGYDEAVLDLLAEREGGLGHVAVINQPLSASEATWERLKDRLGTPSGKPILAPNGFQDALDAGGLITQFFQALN